MEHWTLYGFNEPKLISIKQFFFRNISIAFKVKRKNENLTFKMIRYLFGSVLFCLSSIVKQYRSFFSSIWNSNNIRKTKKYNNNNIPFSFIHSFFQIIFSIDDMIIIILSFFLKLKWKKWKFLSSMKSFFFS